MLAPSPQVGAILGGRYVVLEQQAEAPGHVELRVLDRDVEVEVALWWMRPELFDDAARQDALLGVGVELRALHHPALRRCFGAGRGEGGAWTTWQPASGPGPRVGTAPIAPLELVRWIDAVAGALGALHDAGFVHGRLAPASVVAVGGALKVGGGGLWRDVEPAAAARAWRDDPHLAPERRRGAASSASADVWTMASIALALLAGEGGAGDPARAVARSQPGLAAMLVGAMAADPSRRAEVGVLAEALRNAAAAAAAPGVPSRRAAGKGGKAGAASEPTLVGHGAAPAAAPARSPAPSPPPPPPSPSPSPSRPPSPAPSPLPAPSPAASRPSAAPSSVSAPPAPASPTQDPGAAAALHRASAISGALPTPARVELAGAMDRARTAQPGQYRLQAVSMKPQADPADPAAPARPEPADPDPPRVKLRPLSDVAPRTYSVAPRALGNLAPPKAQEDAADAARRRRILVIAAVAAVVTALVVGIAALVL